MENVTTLQHAIIHFKDYENCHNLMVQLRWPDGKVTCPYCGSEKVTYLAKARVWKCYSKHPRPRFSLKVGTIFEDSPIGLDKWLTALWLLVNCKNGVSSYEISRDLGISQKAAWFVLQRLRHVLKDMTVIPMSGPVEADESFHGGKPKYMDRYLDEATFRFNHRINHTDSSRFVQALAQVVNRRLTYAELTGKEAGSEA